MSSGGSSLAVNTSQRCPHSQRASQWCRSTSGQYRAGETRFGGRPKPTPEHGLDRACGLHGRADPVVARRARVSKRRLHVVRREGAAALEPPRSGASHSQRVTTGAPHLGQNRGTPSWSGRSSDRVMRSPPPCIPRRTIDRRRARDPPSTASPMAATAPRRPQPQLAHLPNAQQGRT
jgi:hypothetical protein